MKQLNFHYPLWVLLENNSNYIQFPQDAFKLQTSSAIKQGVSYGDFTFQILKNKLVTANNSPKYGQYILPVVIESVSQNKIHPINNLVLIPFNYHE